MHKMVLAAVVAWSATAAGAQQQTVESAQEFLRQVLPGLEVDAGGWYHQLDLVYLKRYAAIRSVKTEERCVSDISVRYGPFRYHWKTQRGHPEVREYPAESVTRSLDARKFTEVEAFAGDAVVRIRSHGVDAPTVRIRVPSKDLRDRLAYALEFLRQKCDAAASTGF